MTDHLATTSAVERVARVLAAWPLSLHGDGGDSSVSTEVEAEWPDRIEQAMAVLKVLREPDAAMAAVGDMAIWTRMIEAAIAGEAVGGERSVSATGPTPEIRDAGAVTAGSPWTRRDEAVDESFPASDPPPVNPGSD